VRDVVASRLSTLLGCAVGVRAETRGIEEPAVVRDLAAGSPFSLALRGAGAARGVLVSSRLFPSIALRRLAGSERLAVSQAFCRAALELCALHAAAAVSAHTGGRFTVEAAHDTAAKAPLAGPFVRLRITLDAAGESSDVTIFFTACPAPKPRGAPPAPSARLRASVYIETPPLDLGLLRALAPGDVVVAWRDGGAPRAGVSIGTGDGREIACTLDGEQLVNDGTVRINAVPAEVTMNEAKVIDPRPDGDDAAKAGAPAARPLDGLRIPARLEVAAFEISAADLARLSVGQVLECRADLKQTARLYVCGALFAEGRVESHEGFHGFRVDTVL